MKIDLPYKLGQEVWILWFGLVTSREKCPICKGTRAVKKRGAMMDCTSCNMTGLAKPTQSQRWSVSEGTWPISSIIINTRGVEYLLGSGAEYLSRKDVDIFETREQAQAEVENRNLRLIKRDQVRADPQYRMKKVLGLIKEEDEQGEDAE